MPKQLIIANGRGDYGRNRTQKFPQGFDGHLFVAAERGVWFTPKANEHQVDFKPIRVI